MFSFWRSRRQPPLRPLLLQGQLLLAQLILLLSIFLLFLFLIHSLPFLLLLADKQPPISARLFLFLQLFQPSFLLALFVVPVGLCTRLQWLPSVLESAAKSALQPYPVQSHLPVHALHGAGHELRLRQVLMLSLYTKQWSLLELKQFHFTYR